MEQVADLPQGMWGSSAGAFVAQGFEKQGSDKQCRLTQQGSQKVETALKDRFGESPSDSKVAEFYSFDRGTVGKIRNLQGWLNLSSIDRLFTALSLNLELDDYESLEVKSDDRPPKNFAPNPFEQPGLWGCDELLRRMFEQLGKGGSQALIGPTGCGKSEILQLIKQIGSERLGRSPDQFLYIDMHWICDATGFFDELGDQLNFGTDKPNDLRRRLAKANKSYVLCLDSIHVLRNETFFPDTTRNWLRGMAEMPGFPLQLVVSSQRQLRALFPDTSCISSPLADFFNGQTEYLSYWNEDQLQTVLAERLMSTEVNFETAQIKQLFEDTQGNPKAVREMAARLYDAKIREYLA
jgi:energy-coupling factor transporter ATP-binding protein EcfA2